MTEIVDKKIELANLSVELLSYIKAKNLPKAVLTPSVKRRKLKWILSIILILYVLSRLSPFL